MAAAAGLTGWLASRWHRFDGPSRVAGLDLARGLAVIGMLAAHLLVIDAFDPTAPDTWIDVVNGRSSILFATLAGVSLALITGGRTPRRGAARARASARIALRGALLWVLGLALVSTGVPVYVILPAYALLFFLALPFLGLRSRTLFLVAAVVGLVMPLPVALVNDAGFWLTPDGELVSAVIGWAYPFPLWIAFLLAGLGIGRLDLRRLRTAAALLAVGSALAVLGYALAVAAADAAGRGVWGAVWTAEAHSGGVLEVIGSGGFAVAVIGACLLICRTPLRWLVVPLRAVGGMPLSAYTAQIVAWALVATAVLGSPTDLDAFRALHPFWPLTLTLVAACTAWALLVGRGPLEAALARLSAWAVREPARPEGVDRLGA